MTDSEQTQYMAGTLGLKIGAMQSTQTQLIRAIQQCRGDETCFGTDKRSDCAEICEWRRDCRPHKAAWLR